MKQQRVELANQERDDRKSRMDVKDFMIVNRRLDNIKYGYEVLR